MSDVIRDPEALQDRIGKLGAPRDMKVIDFLDDHARRWISASPLLFAAFGDAAARGIALTLGGDAPGFVRVDDDRRLSFPTHSLDAPEPAIAGARFGSLLLVPGLGETLRVNGRVADVAGGRVTIAVEECYLHCAKAMIRSAFWEAPAGVAGDDDAPALLAHCRLMALATIDADGRADVSPKGDPAGTLLRLHDGAVWFPDRPGNRRVDSFRNILSQPRVAVLALLPGSGACVRLSGTASLSTDATMREAFAVEGKAPTLVTRIDAARLAVQRSEALMRVAPWSRPASPPVGIDPAAIFRDHVRLSRERGVQAALVRATVSVPGLMRKGLESDYKKNLY